MILAVKKNNKGKFLKVLLLIILLGISGAYYYHTNKVFEENQKIEQEKKKALQLQEEEKENTKKEAENAILTEIEKAVDLVGQEHVKHVKIMDNKVIIVCDINTNLDALTVRYGVMALVKRTLNDVVIAIDVNFILKSKLNEK